MKRTIVFGDIHGCHEEWQELMRQVKATDSDRLVAVGDLCCKGPSTRKTLDLAMRLPNLRCILGNHDWHLLSAWRNKKLDHMKEDYQQKAVRELGDDADKYMRFIATWPYYLDLEECLAVHAGIRPGVPLSKQVPHDMLFLRTIEPDHKPWYETYTAPKLIIHGHWAKQGLVVRENVIGLDTGCVYGRELSCVILPSREIVSIKAKRAYCPV